MSSGSRTTNVENVKKLPCLFRNGIIQFYVFFSSTETHIYSFGPLISIFMAVLLSVIFVLNLSFASDEVTMFQRLTFLYIK